MKAHYIRADMKRLFKNPWLYIGILGVTAGLFYGQEGRALRDSVIAAYWISVSLSGLTILYLFCILPFGLVLCEDLEHQFLRCEIIRGDVVRYALCKTGMIYCSAVMTMVLGSGLFALLARTKRPWCNEEIPIERMFREGAFGWILANGHAFLFILIYAAVLGLLAGTLSVLAAFLSLFISNKVMVVVLPVCALQCWRQFVTHRYLSAFTFHLYTKIFEKDWQCVLLALAVSLLPVCLLAAGIVFKIRKRL